MTLRAHDNVDVEASLAYLGKVSTHADENADWFCYVLGRPAHLATASGSASSGPMPGAAWGPSSWPSTRS